MNELLRPTAPGTSRALPASTLSSQLVGFRRVRIHRGLLPIILALLGLPAAPLKAQLFNNLTAYASRWPVGDPSVRATNSPDGPKGIATADFNGDGRPDLAVANTDGTVTIYRGTGQGKFAPPLHLQTGVQELRGIIADDLTGDGRPDVTVAAPYAGKLYLFANTGGDFADPVALPMWDGARNLVAGDFNADGRRDLVVAGTTNGLRQLRNLGAGDFAVVTNLVTLGATNIDFPKPLYALGAFRPAGESRDELVATHADSDKLWVLAPGADGSLRITGVISNQAIHALAIGSILQPANSGALDLITASRNYGTISIHRGTNSPGRFLPAVHQRIQVPGGPRALVIADLNGDGWNDLAVVLRNFDRVLSYHNSNGVLVATTELPVGHSPREMVSADFNADGRPDVAVMNRDSKDISVLLAHPGQASFSTLDQIYPVDGEVSGLTVLDFNRDGRGDVIQLHRASGEFSVRTAKPGGLLNEPVFYPMGTLPSAQATVDVNGDHIPDMVSANLGRYSLETGSISVRLGDGQGAFGPEQRFYLPAEATGSLFALVGADFDNDGDIDLAAGFFDCRLAFFENTGGGQFRFTKSHRFVYESRVMTVGDFDQDGDTDLAGAGYAGDVVVIENEGNLLTTSELKRTDYKATSGKKFGTRDIVTADVNNDGDLDLLVGSGDGVMMFLGGEGMTFFKLMDKLPGTDFPASSVTLGDFDGNGTRDVAVSCRILSCISILTPDTNGVYQPALSVDVPSGEFLAAGDLDGDGQADLVGSGNVLWTALSSRRAQAAPPTSIQADRSIAPRLVINEFLAINTDLPLDSDGDRTSDWLELFNAGTGSLSLNGWKLRLTEPGTSTNVYLYSFPPTAFLAPKTHLLLVCSENKRTLYHTGFRLPGNGGTLTILNASGQEMDRVDYAAQQENVSYGRYRDGMASFAANPYPSPSRPNTDNGPVEPAAQIDRFEPAPPAPGQPLRFHASGRDDVGIVGLTVVWQRLDIQESEPHRVLLYDDGSNNDEGVLDGIFSGVLPTGLPPNGAIQFYLEITDLNGVTIQDPSDPVFASPGQPVTLHTLGVGSSPLPIEISEIVAANDNGLRDESGLTPDWVEVRNTSAQPVSLRGVSLGSGFFGWSSRYVFRDDEAPLNPGEHRVIYCDNRPDLGRPHAPFGLSRSGDHLTLTGTATNGARLLGDSVAFGPQSSDRAWARLGPGGPWRSTQPTPREPNVTGWEGIVSRAAGTFELAFPTTTNATYVVEYTDALGGIWTPLPAAPGTGLEQIVRQGLAPERYYRVRRDP